MEFYFREVGLSHLKHIVAIGKEYVATLFVGGHELVLTFLECCECMLVVTFNPACFVEAYRLPTALCAILVEEAILDNFKLELTDRADNFAIVELVGKELCDTFVHELVYAFLKLFCFHRIGILDIFEHLRREAWQAFEVEFFA